MIGYKLFTWLPIDESQAFGVCSLDDNRVVIFNPSKEDALRTVMELNRLYGELEKLRIDTIEGW